MANKIKTTKLFGIEQKERICKFVHSEGEGFWFIEQGERTVGETTYLEPITSELEQVDSQNNWRIIEILQKHKVKLIEEYKQKNPDNLKPEQLALMLKDDSRDLTIALESYIRSLIEKSDITHWAIYDFSQSFINSVSNKLLLKQQIAFIKAAFKYRYVDNSVVNVSSEDPQVGTVPLKAIMHSDAIGASDIDIEEILPTLPEKLAAKIFIFMRDDFRGISYQTDKQQEIAQQELKKQLETQETSNAETDPEEEDQKKPVLNESQKQKTKSV
ncbi:hypothetical protein DAPPUDRAFT_119053 [Daphnia pulex]|uniref:Uncharacterized protein n=1 Tax=Daphnia pulex TaxID=6669 RepID=E9HXA9_DAPPU|nr:hypothetical protein DAPPUDRAFT_119053 [Daphnia pulex]|eukprot:EFX63621.1 hypothetical protein DAPPUDRAFT_119053 [Daphnia pulex]